MTSVNATEYKIHNLDGNPGLLPLNLGVAQNEINYFSFAQVFDLTNLTKEFQLLQNQFHNLHLSFGNASNYHTEYYNSFNLIKVLENKILTQFTQLNPEYKVKRNKRGLINGLGSIIKIITGNLDNEDAEKYDKAIMSLSENGSKMKNIVDKQLTLLQKSINNFQNFTKSLDHNQLILTSRIMQVQSIIKNIELKNLDTARSLLIQIVMFQIKTSYQMIYDTLEKIEVAISFAKINTFHNSIVYPLDLLQEMSKINKILTHGKLPFEPEINNILLFEKILIIKGCMKLNEIIFILEIPIVESEIYKYYHLYPLPVPYENSFRVTIPKRPYLILNEQNYISFDENCQEILPNNYLCKERERNYDQDRPCEVQMLKYENTTKCQSTRIEVNTTKIQKLEDNKWMIIAPVKSVSIFRCLDNVNNVALKGTYLIELDYGCDMQINKAYRTTKLRNFRTT